MSQPLTAEEREDLHEWAFLAHRDPQHDKVLRLLAERDELAAELAAIRACWEGAIELERLREAGP